MLPDGRPTSIPQDESGGQYIPLSKYHLGVQMSKEGDQDRRLSTSLSLPRNPPLDPKDGCLPGETDPPGNVTCRHLGRLGSLTAPLIHPPLRPDQVRTLETSVRRETWTTTTSLFRHGGGTVRHCKHGTGPNTSRCLKSVDSKKTSTGPKNQESQPRLVCGNLIDQERRG